MSDAIVRILVPIDFSTHSERALRYATMLASRFGASLELLHVVEDPVMYGSWGPEVFVPNIAELMQAVTTDAEKRLEGMKVAPATAGVKVETSVIVGRAPHRITEYARSSGVDLIVMGTHGRTGLSHVLMGSVAEGIVRHAHCPVLTMRGAEHVGASA